jgi:hypothetical protein
MPSKTSKKKPSTLPTIPKELIDQIVDGPMTPCVRIVVASTE